MRQLIAAGNWKMNTNHQEGLDLANAIAAGKRAENVLVIFGVPATHLKAVADVVSDVKHVEVAAQNCHQAEKGAFTGEIAARMIGAVGAKYVILGHSERREYFSETDDLIAKKIDTAFSNGLSVIYCCGEKLPIREAGQHVEVVAQQIQAALFHLSADDFAKIVIAYEPVWAIGTGVTASPEQAQEMHKAIRGLIAEKYDAKVADNTSILYGGSVKPHNAKEIFAQADVDGGLVGGASLKADAFLEITNSFA